MKDEPNWYEQDAMSVNSTPTSPESERKKTTSESMGSDKGDKARSGRGFDVKNQSSKICFISAENTSCR